MPSAKILPLATQLRATPPARQRFFRPVSARIERARRSMTSFFFSCRRRHASCLSDWSSDVCSSDLASRRDFPLWSTLLLQFRPHFSFGKSEDKSVPPGRRTPKRKKGHYYFTYLIGEGRRFWHCRAIRV